MPHSSYYFQLQKDTDYTVPGMWLFWMCHSGPASWITFPGPTAATAQLRKYTIKTMPRITVANRELLKHLAELEMNIRSLAGAHY